MNILLNRARFEVGTGRDVSIKNAVRLERRKTAQARIMRIWAVEKRGSRFIASPSLTPFVLV